MCNMEHSDSQYSESNGHRKLRSPSSGLSKFNQGELFWNAELVSNLCTEDLCLILIIYKIFKCIHVDIVLYVT